MGKDTRTDILSVIIPSCNISGLRERAYHKLIWAIEDQTYRDFELIEQRVTLPKGILFNKSKFINRAVEATKHDNLLILDADIEFKSDYFQKVHDFIGDHRMFMGFDRARLLPGRDNPEERITNNDGLRACALSWFCKKDFFWEFGGMNEKYEGYGNEDVDAFIRAKHLYPYLGELNYEIVHNYHHWHTEGSCYPLNEKRLGLLEDTKKDIQKEINRLCLANKKKISL